MPTSSRQVTLLQRLLTEWLYLEERITNGPFDQEVISSSLTLEDPDLKAILASSTTRKNKKKKKKGKPGEGVKLSEGDKTMEEDAQDTKTTEAASDSAS